jgi:citrate lyase beta subunit
MRHFGFLSAGERDRLFECAPQDFGPGSDLDMVGVALGATLYCPATRPRLADDIARRVRAGVTSVVVCLEDAVADGDLAAAEHNAVGQLRRLDEVPDEPPLVFVRVRAASQIPMLLAGLGEHACVLTGFVVPKFAEESGNGFLEAAVAGSEQLGRRLLVMPVLEGPEIAHAETRLESLLGARRLLDKYRDHVPAVRVGATDLSAAYGLRRGRDFTVWDVRVVADALAAVVNVFSRDDASNGGGYVVTGPVWEYFPRPTERILKTQLRETPFAEQRERALRAELIAKDLDGLIREVLLDRTNGLLGKTVIHPSHVAAVHALSVVPAEEYRDVCDVLATASRGGASASRAGDKMNESKPHAAWARLALRRARAFGVAREGVTFVDLLAAGLHP